MKKAGAKKVKDTYPSRFQLSPNIYLCVSLITYQGGDDDEDEDDEDEDEAPQAVVEKKVVGYFKLQFSKYSH